MKNVSHDKGWNSGMTQEHLEPLSIPLIKGTYYGKSEKYFINLKFHKYPTSITSDLYEFRVFLFENGEP